MPYQINVNIVASPAETVPYLKEVTLLCDPDVSLISRQVEALFVKKGFCVRFSTLDQIPPANQDIISLLDLTAPFLNDISAQKLITFQHYIGRLESAGMLWATRSSQMGCKDPRYSQILGLARTIRSELLIDFATFEMDIVNDSALEALCEVFGKFRRRAKGPDLDPDWEFALFEGTINIPRYHWFPISQQLSVISEETLPRKLEMGKSGLLQSLQWVQGKRVVLIHDQVEIEPRAVGLNFKVPYIVEARSEKQTNSFLGSSRIFGSGRWNKRRDRLGRLWYCPPDRARGNRFEDRRPSYPI